ncbi:MAG: NfeD family protein [Pseudomonadota bacterium]
MIELLDQIEFWHWWVAAVIFLIIEILAPGVAFLWLAVSAGVTGVVALLFPEMSWQVQFTIWGILSVATVTASRFILKRNPIETDDTTLNKRGSQYLGRKFTLQEPIVNGQGKLKVDDTIWKVEADEDLPAGCTVEVEAIEVTTLKVVRS